MCYRQKVDDGNQNVHVVIYTCNKLILLHAELYNYI